MKYSIINEEMKHYASSMPETGKTELIKKLESMLNDGECVLICGGSKLTPDIRRWLADLSEARYDPAIPDYNQGYEDGYLEGCESRAEFSNNKSDTNYAEKLSRAVAEAVAAAFKDF